MRLKRTLAGVGATALLATGIPLTAAPAANAFAVRGGGGNLMLQETLTASATKLKPGRSAAVRLKVRNMDPLRTQTGRYTITPAYPLEFTRRPGGCYMSGQSAVCTMTVRALKTATKTMRIRVNKNATESGWYSITGAGTVSIYASAPPSAPEFHKLTGHASYVHEFNINRAGKVVSPKTVGNMMINEFGTVFPMSGCEYPHVSATCEGKHFSTQSSKAAYPGIKTDAH